MRNRAPVLRGAFVVAAAVLLVYPSFARAQANNIAPRINAAIDENNRVTLHGNTHPLARPENDRGEAPAGLPMERMLLVLQRGASQEAALEALLEQQQDASSPNFHKWLTPQQFGQQFGPSDQDIQTVTAWLQSHGFQVAGVSNGRTVIEFSGTAGQVQEAFHTTIHRYAAKGEEHWANSTDPQFPAALTPVVVGINTLHNFPRQQMHEVLGAFSWTKTAHRAQPIGSLFTFPTGGCGAFGLPNCYAVAPADFAKIYTVPNLLLNPAPATQYNGDGVTIVVVGQSDINPSDISQFRTLFGLPAPKLNVIVSGPDPGINGAETEADLDIQWAGAVAPNATIDFVIAEDTEASLGVDLAAQYAVDNNLGAVLNESFGVCEFFMGTADNAFYNQLWQQAAAQGTTVTVSSGDSGSAGCDRSAGISGPAQLGLSVSGFSSTPYNISVGGTDFNDVNNIASFWNTTPSDTPAVASAKGYIPEVPWNDTCTNQEVFSFFSTTNAEQTCNNPQVTQNNSFLLDTVAGSGGKSGCTTSNFNPPLFGTGNLSSCAGGYPKPAWQTGAGVPSDGKRDVPDVSLFAADGFNSSFYLICESDVDPVETSCDPNAAQSDALGVGGTSASSPAFAGIMALVNQATGSRQGNANYILYKLAAQSGSSCTSAANPASTCVFYDIPSGSTIAMPCLNGSPNCTVNTQSDSVGVLSGYATTTGYDPATGLGSVNANNLVTKWKNFSLTASSTTLSLNGGSAVNITHGESVNVDIGVTGAGGTPSGNVSLIANTGPDGEQGVQGFILSGGSSTGSTNALPGGSYTVFARYSGDGTFGASSSSPPVAVDVSAEPSKIFANLVTLDINGNVTSFNAPTATYGSGFSFFRVDVGDAAASFSPSTGISSNCSKGLSNCPTGTVSLTPSGALGVPSLALNSKGYAEVQSLAVGTFSFSASYQGDSSYVASAAPVNVNFTISKAPTTLTAAVAGSPVIQNNSSQIVAQLATTSDGIEPTGTFTFLVDGATATGPILVSQGSGFFPSSPSSPPNYAYADGTTSIEFAIGGKHTLSAQYSGDANYAPSTSPDAQVTVLWATNTSLTPSSPTIMQGQSVTFTAQVTGTQPQTPFTGTANFMASPGGTLCNAVSVSASGVATCTASSLPVGQDLVRVDYSGDGNYAPSQGMIFETVSPAPTFTISANPTTVPVASPGQSGSTTLTFTSQNGFTSNSAVTVTPTCTGLPSESSCSSGASVTIAANGSATATLTFRTTAPSAVTPSFRSTPPKFDVRTPLEVMALACLLLLVSILTPARRRLRVRGAILFLVVGGLVVAAAGCGGGGGGGGGGGNSNPGTPIGQFNVTVSVTINGVTANVPVTLNVQ